MYRTENEPYSLLLTQALNESSINIFPHFIVCFQLSVDFFSGDDLRSERREKKASIMSNLYDDYDSPTHKQYPKSGGYQIRTIIGSGTLDGDKMTFNKHDANERYRALCILKDLIGASRDLALKDKSCYADDEFLYRFLFARKFNVTEAFQLLINYQRYRQKNHELLQRLCVLDDTIQMALRDGFPGVLKSRDRRGRKVLVFFTSNWDYTQYSLLTVYRAMLLTLEKLLENKQNQANGFVAIVDWTNFTLRQSAHLNPKIFKLMIEGLQVS